MSKNKSSHGSCLCGAVSLLAKSANTHVGACHCDFCRKWTGGPLLSVDCGTEVGFIGHEYIGVYASSEWAERGFCKQCGSGLFYKLKKTGQYMVPAGLLDNEADFSFEQQIFIDEKPAYYDFANSTKNMTSKEVFAHFTKE